MSSKNNTNPIQVVHATHPINEALFNVLAPSSKNIRTARNRTHLMCAKCLRIDDEPGVAVRQCSKCKSAWYCSKECQSQDWAEHKKSCSTVDASILKLVQNMCSNRTLNIFIQSCFVLEFNLLRRPQLTQPFMARVDIAVEPANPVELVNIMLGQPVGNEEILGMVQVNAFTPIPQATMNLPPTRQKVWREAREAANKAGDHSQSVGLVEIAYADSARTITFPIVIERPVMQMVQKSEPFTGISAITGQIRSRPFSLDACMEFMNSHIRADKNNQLLLRAQMRSTDIQIIRDAAGNSATVPARILREKMAREDIYRSLYQHLNKSAPRSFSKPFYPSSYMHLLCWLLTVVLVVYGAYVLF
ncbi:hypothetical protein B0H11DRAFT_2007374 [Mycena galericulata]|nr:hypothetical protein B0H11DRAFT_2007374 [Mycena galericulata]